MSDNLIEVRKQKHQVANGRKYPLSLEDEYSNIQSVIESFSKNSGNIPTSLDSKIEGQLVIFGARICGRITLFRKNGALCFLNIRDASGSIQIIAKRNHTEDYEYLSKKFDLGDIIETSGELRLSKTGEKSILVDRILLLSKALASPPEKFAGLSDTEIKYRKRYLDLMSSEESRAAFVVRSLTIRALRNYLDMRSFLEVETSTLNTISSGANAKPFISYHNQLESEMFLRIAPELYLKRLVVGGFDRVYEIGRCYRNEGVSSRHNPEFTMLEFYQAYGKFNDLLEHAKTILSGIDSEIEKNLPPIYQNIWQKWKSERHFTFDNFAIVSMENAVSSSLKKLGFISSEDLSEVSHPDYDSLSNINKNLLKDLKQQLSNCSSRGQRLFVYFEYLSEPNLCDDYRTEDGKYSLPVFITEYPTDICPLARQNDDNPNVCDRFELFVNGRELANAFQELNDPDEQEKRFKDQLKSNEKDPMAYDGDYVEALQHGMPPCIGFGLGIDRMIMLLVGAWSIKDVILFPTMKPIKV